MQITISSVYLNRQFKVRKPRTLYTQAQIMVEAVKKNKMMVGILKQMTKATA